MRIGINIKSAVFFSGMLLFVFILVGAISTRQSDTLSKLATAELSDFEVRVNTVGFLDAERAHMVSSTIKGDKGKIISLVDDGTIVKEGDVLIRFDPAPFEDETLQLSGEVASKEAVVEAEKQILEWEKSQAEGAVNDAEFNLQDARQEYDRYNSYIKDLEDLSKKGYSFPTEIFQARKKAEQLLAKLEKEETKLDQIKEEAVFKIAGSMAKLKKAESELQTARLSLEEARNQLKKTIIHAPFSGIVALHESFRDNQKRKPRVGDTVWQNQPLLYLPEISSMIVKTQVREINLHKIKIGQKAAIRVDAYPDIMFNGHVISIGVLASDRIESGRGEKYFQFTIAVEGEDSRLRPGMTARVSINVDSVENALSLPVQAVFYEGEKKYCYVHAGLKYKKVTVSTGRYNEDVVEILSGLKQGDTVSLLKPSSDDIF